MGAHPLVALRFRVRVVANGRGGARRLPFEADALPLPSATQRHLMPRSATIEALAKDTPGAARATLARLITVRLRPPPAGGVAVTLAP